MKDVSIETITKAFLGYCSDETDERTMFVLKSMVEHLHAFAKETELTHEEWLMGINFLKKAGEISDSKRNEFVLISDTTGMSASSCLGPFHILGAPKLPVGGDLKRDNDGATVVIEGFVQDTDGNPIRNAVLELWQTADNGLYSNQDDAQDEYNLRCSMEVDENGRYALTTVRPSPYKIPDDGPVGDLLRATGRDAWRPSHLHFIIVADGYRSLVTEVFPSNDIYLDRDAVFGVREDLIMEYKEKMDLDELPTDLAVGRNVTQPYFKVDFNFILVPENT
jgi:hydroxyquinol 1,2-dioxygenase